MFICTVVVIGNRGSAGIDLGPWVHLRSGDIHGLRIIPVDIRSARHGQKCRYYHVINRYEMTKTGYVGFVLGKSEGRSASRPNERTKIIPHQMVPKDDYPPVPIIPVNSAYTTLSPANRHRG